MANSIPPTIPESGDGKTPPEKQPGDKRAQNSKKNVGSAHGNGFTEPKSLSAFSAILFLVIEAAAFILWQIAEIGRAHV